MKYIAMFFVLFLIGCEQENIMACARACSGNEALNKTSTGMVMASYTKETGCHCVAIPQPGQCKKE